MTDNQPGVATDRSERIASLDVLRGVALLGILIMNIQSFSMPGAAYINPTAYGDLTGINWWTWVVSHVVADQKFISIFSMLFGAGVCLFADRATARTGRSAALHYRRTFWLLVFGLLHAHLLWYGDILVAYALCAVWVYLLRNRSATALFVAGVLVVAVSSAIYLFFGAGLGQMPADAASGVREAWAPGSAAIAAEIRAYQGGWLEQLPVRSAEAFFLETFVFLTVFLWRAGGMMLIGMALYKWGFLSAGLSGRRYTIVAVGAGLTGLALIGAGLRNNVAAGFSLEYSMFFGSQFNYWGSAFLSVAYVALVMLAVRYAVAPAFQRRLAAVGRTAFTNYILQTVIGTLIFYGHGLGLFGDVPRYQQMLIVFGVWALQLWAAPIWLARYRFGPLEWAWRSLTYWRWQRIG